MNEKKKSYPVLAVKHWWALRNRFKETIPGIVTDNYISTTLNMKPASAQTNILPSLKAIGFIDGEGKINSELAIKWRDDEQYKTVCGEIVEMTYPNELLDAIANPLDDIDSVKRWFSNETGAGQEAVRRMTAFYLLLFEGNPNSKPVQKTKVLKTSSKAVVSNQYSKKKSKKESLHERPENKPYPGDLPSVNINIEIHISSDASPDQIDKIFESMASHIYKKHNQ